MSGAMNVIQSYLVSLGFDIDKNSYNDTKKSIETVSKGLTDFAGGAVKAFSLASVAVASFGVAATAGIAKFMDGLGNQEIQMEKLSRQMWTTQEQAMAFNATLKAMGANLQDLYLSPTLMKQYQQLHNVAMEMQTPTDYREQIKMVQDVQLQVKQMKLEVYYSLQWVGYYFTKYMSGPISKVKDILQNLNTAIVKNMPTWTKRVAEVMASFVQAGAHIVEALSTFWNWLKKLADYIPGWAKIVMGAFAVFSISNPFMLFVEGISAILFLLDDFETYLHGGQSALQPFWEWLTKIADQLNKIGTAKDTINSLKGVFSDLGDTFKVVGNILQGLFKALKSKDIILGFTEYVKNAAKVSKDLADALDSISKGIDHLVKLQGSWTMFWDTALQAILRFERFALGPLEGLAKAFKGFGDAMQGDWKSAASDFSDFFSGKSMLDVSGLTGLHNWAVGITNGSASAPPNYIYPQSSSATSVHAPMTVTQNIYGSGDPNATGKAAANALVNPFDKQMYAMKGWQR